MCKPGEPCDPVDLSSSIRPEKGERAYRRSTMLIQGILQAAHLHCLRDGCSTEEANQVMMELVSDAVVIAAQLLHQSSPPDRATHVSMGGESSLTTGDIVEFQIVAHVATKGEPNDDHNVADMAPGGMEEATAGA